MQRHAADLKQVIWDIIRELRSKGIEAEAISCHINLYGQIKKMENTFGIQVDVCKSLPESNFVVRGR